MVKKWFLFLFFLLIPDKEVFDGRTFSVLSDEEAKDLRARVKKAKCG